ncbi:hypothetical protein EDD21DRAFT_357566 [Dissophora ornata]|nr:hypothetical protein EDD21DRAFT_357566 [Dissophora ornata]
MREDDNHRLLNEILKATPDAKADLKGDIKEIASQIDDRFGALVSFAYDTSSGISSGMNQAVKNLSQMEQHLHGQEQPRSREKRTQQAQDKGRHLQDLRNIQQMQLQMMQLLRQQQLIQPSAQLQQLQDLNTQQVQAMQQLIQPQGQLILDALQPQPQRGLLEDQLLPNALPGRAEEQADGQMEEQVVAETEEQMEWQMEEHSVEENQAGGQQEQHLNQLPLEPEQQPQQPQLDGLAIERELDQPEEVEAALQAVEEKLRTMSMNKYVKSLGTARG